MEQARYTYTREELLERLCEPFGSLTPEEVAAAQTAAATDSEVALALKQCRAMSGLRDVAIFGSPRTSDAAFVVALRMKLAEPEKAALWAGVFGSGRLVAAVATVCVVAMLVIFSAGTRFSSGVATLQPVEAAALETFASAIDPAATVIPDSMSDQTVDAESLAVYLNMPELASNWSFYTDSDQPLSDELLSLDTQTLQEVLNDLEHANFF